jgi:hypothetical protein
MALTIMERTGRNDPYFAAQNIQVYDEQRICRNLLAKEFGYLPGALLDIGIGQYLELEADSAYLAKKRDEMYKKATETNGQ